LIYNDNKGELTELKLQFAGQRKAYQILSFQALGSAFMRNSKQNRENYKYTWRRYVK